MQLSRHRQHHFEIETMNLGLEDVLTKTLEGQIMGPNPSSSMIQPLLLDELTRTPLDTLEKHMQTHSNGSVTVTLLWQSALGGLCLRKICEDTTV